MWPNLLLDLVRAQSARAVTFTTGTPTSPLSLSSSPPNCLQFQAGSRDADLTLGGKQPACVSILCHGSGVLVYAPRSPLPGTTTGDLALSVVAGQEIAIEATAIRASSTIAADSNGVYFTAFYPRPGVVGGNP